MDKSKMTTLLTAALSLGSASETTTALSTWSDKWVPALTADARELFDRDFAWTEVGEFAETAVNAAQELKGVLKGIPRARVAQTVFSAGIKAVLPDNVEHWIIPMLEGPAVEALIEAAFRRLEASGKLVNPPVADAPELPEGRIE